MAYALEHAGRMSTRERARFLKDVAASLKEKDRAKLAKLREDIAEVKKRRRAAMGSVRSKCRRLRQRVREQVKAFREQERARINGQVEKMRAAARAMCETRKETVRSAGRSLESKAKGELQAERLLQSDLRVADRWGKQKFKACKVQLRSESDDEVRSNIGPELEPVWEKVKRSIRGSDCISRTEAFIQWLEENPGDAIAIQQDAADVELKRLLKEQKAAEREVKKRKAKRYKLTKRQLAAHLEGVPF